MNVAISFIFHSNKTTKKQKKKKHKTAQSAKDQLKLRGHKSAADTDVGTGRERRGGLETTLAVGKVSASSSIERD